MTGLMHPSTVSTPTTARRIPAWYLGVCLFILALLPQLPALRAGFIWDDAAYVASNRLLGSFSGLCAIWLHPGIDELPYYPMTFTSYSLEHILWGNHPQGYHLTNILLHALNAVLLWRVLAGLKFRAAWFAALLFAVHPMTVESVAWIAERKNVLALFLGLLAVMTYLRFASLLPTRQVQWKLYLLSLLAFFLAMASKTAICLLPFMLLTLVWWKHPLTRKDLLSLVPFLLITVSLALITTGQYLYHGGITELTTGQRLAVAGQDLSFYAGKVLFPWPLMQIYPRWDPAALNWSHAAALFAILAVIAALAATQRRGIATGITLIILALLPVLGFLGFSFLQFSFVADHFAYFALVPATAMLAWLGATLLPRRAKMPAGAVVILLLALLSRRQAGLYVDDETLWRDNLAYNQAWPVQLMLADCLNLRQQYAAAWPCAEACVKGYPDFPDCQYELAVAGVNTGHAAQALDSVRSALQRNPSNKTLRAAEAHILAAQAASTQPR
jgi:protein O-mannosyl-transferase